MDKNRDEKDFEKVTICLKGGQIEFHYWTTCKKT